MQDQIFGNNCQYISYQVQEDRFRYQTTKIGDWIYFMIDLVAQDIDYIIEIGSRIYQGGISYHISNVDRGQVPNFLKNYSQLQSQDIIQIEFSSQELNSYKLNDSSVVQIILGYYQNEGNSDSTEVVSVRFYKQDQEKKNTSQIEQTDTTLFIILIVIVAILLLFIIIVIIKTYLNEKQEGTQRIQQIGQEIRHQNRERQQKFQQIVLEKYMPDKKYSFYLKIQHKLKYRYAKKQPGYEDFLKNNQLELEEAVIKDCPICLVSFEEDDDTVISICNHIFHKDCFNSWMVKQSNCPNCRQSFIKKDIVEYIQDQKQKINDLLQKQLKQQQIKNLKLDIQKSILFKKQQQQNNTNINKESLLNKQKLDQSLEQDDNDNKSENNTPIHSLNDKSPNSRKSILNTKTIDLSSRTNYTYRREDFNSITTNTQNDKQKQNNIQSPQQSTNMLILQQNQGINQYEETQQNFNYYTNNNYIKTTNEQENQNIQQNYKLSKNNLPKMQRKDQYIKNQQNKLMIPKPKGMQELKNRNSSRQQKRMKKNNSIPNLDSLINDSVSNQNQVLQDLDSFRNENQSDNDSFQQNKGFKSLDGIEIIQQQSQRDHYAELGQNKKIFLQSITQNQNKQLQQQQQNNYFDNQEEKQSQNEPTMFNNQQNQNFIIQQILHQQLEFNKNQNQNDNNFSQSEDKQDHQYIISDQKDINIIQNTNQDNKIFSNYNFRQNTNQQQLQQQSNINDNLQVIDSTKDIELKLNQSQDK